MFNAVGGAHIISGAVVGVITFITAIVQFMRNTPQILTFIVI